MALLLDPKLPSQIALVGMIAPALSAMLVASVFGGRREVAVLLRRLVHARFALIWWVLAIAIMPTVYGLAALFADHRQLRLLIGSTHWWFLPLSFVYLVIITAGEEVGWRGYALPLLIQRGVSPIAAALALGFVWGAWHLPLRFSAGQPGFPLPLFLIFTVALSVIYMVLLLRTGGSLIPALLLHASTDFAPRILDLNMLSLDFWFASDALLIMTAAALWALARPRVEDGPPNAELVGAVAAFGGRDGNCLS